MPSDCTLTLILWHGSAAADRCSVMLSTVSQYTACRRGGALTDGTERGGVRRRLGLAPSGAAAPALSEQKMLNIAEFSGNPRYSMGRTKG